MPAAFATLKFARALRERTHLTAEQAEGLSEVLAEAVRGGLPTCRASKAR